MQVIAITGGIGAGKSTVRRMFEKLGAFGIDADELARKVVVPGSEGARLLLEAFGPDFFNDQGQLDRKKMASRVFSDPNSKMILEGILHPLIRDAERGIIEKLALTHPECVVAVEIPLLTEGGRSKEYDEVILVKAPESVRISRLVESGRYSAQEAAARIANQAGDPEREGVATRIVENGLDVDATARQVEAIYGAIGATRDIEA